MQSNCRYCQLPSTPGQGTLPHVGKEPRLDGLLQQAPGKNPKEPRRRRVWTCVDVIPHRSYARFFSSCPSITIPASGCPHCIIHPFSCLEPSCSFSAQARSFKQLILRKHKRLSRMHLHLSFLQLGTERVVLKGRSLVHRIGLNRKPRGLLLAMPGGD